MKLAFVSTGNPDDVRHWSGLSYYMAQTLRNQGFELELYAPLQTTRNLVSRFKSQYYKRLRRQNYHPALEPHNLRGYARQIEARLQHSDAQVVFSVGTHAISYLRTDKPVVFWSDATFAGMVNFYPSFTNLCAETFQQGSNMEQAALQRSTLAIYTSDWAADTAREHYQIDPTRIKIVPFGANIECNRTQSDIDALISRRSLDCCRLLFIGVDWERKGGDLAVQVAAQLNQQGLPTMLEVIGCTPPVDLPDFVIGHGFVAKDTPAGRQIIDAALEQAHFLLLPARAECFGIVQAESSSFGVPSLSTNVGGLPSVVINDQNGKLFELDDFVSQASQSIYSFFKEPELLQSLMRSSFKLYQDRLNWQVAGQAVHSLLETIV